MSERIYFSVPEVAERYGVNRSKVCTWIANGDLPAIDTATTRNGQRPRWRISLDALEAFEASREAKPRSSRPKRQRQAKVRQFIK